MDPLATLPSMSNATLLLSALEGGDARAADQLLELVYDELRRLAASRMAKESPGHTLQPTALVHEAWVRLVGAGEPRFANRAHFFAAAAEAMRRILIDRARKKQARRHGGGLERVPLDDCDPATPEADDQLLELNEALERFAVAHPKQAELVKLRYFAGLTLEAAAELMGVSLSTAKNYWAFSRAWLFKEVKKARG